MTQSTTSPYNIDLSNAETVVSVNEGGVPKSFTISNVSGTHCQAAVKSGTTDTIKISRIDTYNTTVDGETIARYYDNGYVTFDVTYGSNTYPKRFNFYANLLGTWKETVEAGARTIAAEQTQYEIDHGNLVKNDSTYQAMQSAVSSLEEWKSQSEGTYDGYAEQIENTNSRLDTAEESIQELTENIRTTVYDISQMSEDEWVYGNASSTSGKTYIENANTLGNGKRVRTVMLLPFSQTMKYDLLAGWSVQFFFYDAEGLSTGYSTNRIIADSDIEGSLVGQGSASFNASSYFAVVMGKIDNSVIDSISDIALSGFVVYDEENSSSVYQQTATLIRQEVAGTGIDITKGKINLRADKVTFSDSQGGNTDKIQIDPTTGTLKAVNAIITGATMIDSVFTQRTWDFENNRCNFHLYAYQTAEDVATGNDYLTEINMKASRFIFWSLLSNTSQDSQIILHLPPAEYFKGQTILINNSLFKYANDGTSSIEKAKVYLNVDTVMTLLNKSAQDAGEIGPDNETDVLRTTDGTMYHLVSNEEWLVNGIWVHNLKEGMVSVLTRSIELTDYDWIELTAWENEYYNENNALRHAIEWKVIRWSKEVSTT